MGSRSRKPTSRKTASRKTTRRRGGRWLKVVKSIQSSIKAGQLPEAWKEGTAALVRWPDDPQLHLLLAAIAEKAREPELVRRHAKKVISTSPHPEAMMMLSRLERQKGNTDASLTWCERALKSKPGHAPYLIQKAGALEEAGRYAEARAVVDPLIATFESQGKPLPPTLRFELAKLLVQEKDHDRAVSVIDDLVNESSTPKELARLAYYLQAKAYDRAGRFGLAFDSATSGNDIGQLEFDPKLYEEQVTTLIDIWSAEQLAKFPLATCDDQLPVFVAGMPRSGTSLIDQIIDAHPKAAGVGELSSIEAFARQLASNYDSDKAPPRLLRPPGPVLPDPSSHCLHQTPARTSRRRRARSQQGIRQQQARRASSEAVPKNQHHPRHPDPRDVAISCYLGGFNNRLHAWTTRLDWAACAWEQSQRMMEHWKATLDIPILDVRYEELVRDPETQFPRLIEFLGLEWDDACRDFYKTRRTVRTLSYDQVNRPLYTSSAGRHANYAARIAEVTFLDYPPRAGAPSPPGVGEGRYRR